MKKAIITLYKIFTMAILFPYLMLWLFVGILAYLFFGLYEIFCWFYNKLNQNKFADWLTRDIEDLEKDLWK